MKAGKFDLIFEKKILVAKNTFEFHFKKPKKFNFKSGQYLRLTLSIIKPDNRGSSRYFTISSSPNDTSITLTTRIVKSSFKLKLAALKKGDRIKAFGPLGYFNFDLKSKKQKILLSGGMGVTPYHSILRTVKNKNRIPSILLISSFSKSDEVIYWGELKEIEKINKNVKVIYTITKGKASKGFEHGRIDSEMIKKYAPNHRYAKFFIVGPEAFEQVFIKLLKNMKIKEENIFSENFPGY